MDFSPVDTEHQAAVALLVRGWIASVARLEHLREFLSLAQGTRR